MTGILRGTLRRPSAPRPAFAETLEFEELLLARRTQLRGVTPGDTPVSIVLLDDMLLMRQALKVLLAQDARVRCIGDTDNVKECAAFVTHQADSVVILNADMGKGAGLEALRALMQLDSPPRVLVLGDGEDPGRLLAMYRAGASGYLTRNVSATELREAIEMIAAGGTYVGSGTARAIATGLRDSAGDHTRSGAHARIDKLSDREKTVLRLVARGYSGPEVAEELGITSKTVDTYRHRIHEKIGLRHRSEYVQLALDAGMLVD